MFNGGGGGHVIICSLPLLSLLVNWQFLNQSTHLSWLSSHGW